MAASGDMPPPMERLTVPGNLDSLDRVRRYVDAAAEAASLDRGKAYKLRMAVDELATNIIVHGYEESGTQGDVTFSVSVDDDALTITVEDTAPEFDMSKKADPEGLDRPLEERQIGGLGVYLIKTSVDEVRYERQGSRNRNTLVVYRSPGAESQ